MSDITKQPGYRWARKALETFDHTALRTLALHAHSSTSDNVGDVGVAKRSAATELHREKDGRYRIDVHVYLDEIPWPAVVYLPTLYRRPGGAWLPAVDSADIAVRWDNEVLDAYAAIYAVTNSESKDSENWALENQITDQNDLVFARFGPLVTIPRATFSTEFVVVRGGFWISSLDEAIVFGTMKGVYGWLRNTGQIPGRKSNFHRDRLAIEYVKQFRSQNQ